VKIVKIAMIVVSILVALAFVGSAMAVPPGKTVEYPDGDQGKVTFSGDTHGVKQGMKCTDCHPKPFGMKKGSFKMTKEDHGKPDFCGKCHDGTKAFSQSTEADCGKCHKKAAPEAPKPEAPKPETPKPETPKPETPKPETPKEETK
jgi:c(7)-type cytochrome triheme protein